MKTIKDIFETYRRGDHLEDAELEALREQMGTIARLTSDFGDIFTLTSAYAGKVERDCRYYLDNREEERQRQMALNAFWNHANGGGVNT